MSIFSIIFFIINNTLSNYISLIIKQNVRTHIHRNKQEPRPLPEALHGHPPEEAYTNKEDSGSSEFK